MMTLEQMADSIEGNLTRAGSASVGPDEWKRILAAMRIAAKLAAIEPLAAEGPSDDLSCFFCNVGEWRDPAHKQDCIWQMAKGATEGR